MVWQKGKNTFLNFSSSWQATSDEFLIEAMHSVKEKEVGADRL